MVLEWDATTYWNIFSAHSTALELFQDRFGHPRHQFRAKNNQSMLVKGTIFVVHAQEFRFSYFILASWQHLPAHSRQINARHL